MRAMKPKQAPLRVLFLAVLALTLPWAFPAHAADPSGPVILVAKREMQDKLYGASVLIVRPIGNDQHVGFIINRPTQMTLGQLFPSHEPSKKVVDPIYVGGPFNAEAIFALVQTPQSPGGHSVRLLPNLFAVFDGNLVDRIIESEPSRARFVAGLVAWKPGELRDELKRGAWHVLEPDAALALRKKTTGMWEELVHRAEVAANAI
jgi:putative transcriptional regulator